MVASTCMPTQIPKKSLPRPTCSLTSSTSILELIFVIALEKDPTPGRTKCDEFRISLFEFEIIGSVKVEKALKTDRTLPEP